MPDTTARTGRNGTDRDVLAGFASTEEIQMAITQNLRERRLLRQAPRQAKRREQAMVRGGTKGGRR
jgi:hypothetical protein